MSSLFIERNGRYVIYPHWIFGRGVLIDEYKKKLWERHIQLFLELNFWAMLIFWAMLLFFIIIGPVPIIYSDVFLVFVIWLVIVGLLYGFYGITSRKILAGAERTLQRLTISDHIEQVVVYQSWPSVIRGSLAIVILNLQPVYLLAFHSEGLTILSVTGLVVSQIIFLIMLLIWVWIVFQNFK